MWFLTGREETGSRVFENESLRKVFGPKGEKVRGCKELHSDAFHSLYSLPAVRVIKIVEYEMGETRGTSAVWKMKNA
jgi:hypothetical protein